MTFEPTPAVPVEREHTLVFTRVERNKPVDAQLVTFTLPKGVDLIGKPLAPLSRRCSGICAIRDCGWSQGCSSPASSRP